PPTSTTSADTLSLHDALPIFLTSAVTACPQASTAAALYQEALAKYRSKEYPAALAAAAGAVEREPEQAAYRHIYGLCLAAVERLDRKSTRLNSSHVSISYAVF